MEGRLTGLVEPRGWGGRLIWRGREVGGAPMDFIMQWVVMLGVRLAAAAVPPLISVMRVRTRHGWRRCGPQPHLRPRQVCVGGWV